MSVYAGEPAPNAVVFYDDKDAETKRLRAELAASHGNADDNYKKLMEARAERDASKAETEKWIQRHIDVTELFETVEDELAALRALLREARVILEEVTRALSWVEEGPRLIDAADTLARINAALNKGGEDE